MVAIAGGAVAAGVGAVAAINGATAGTAAGVAGAGASGVASVAGASATGAAATGAATTAASGAAVGLASTTAGHIAIAAGIGIFGVACIGSEVVNGDAKLGEQPVLAGRFASIDTMADLTEQGHITSDCWKQMVHDTTLEPSHGTPFTTLLQHKNIKRFANHEDYMFVTNVFGEAFKVTAVQVTTDRVALHATQLASEDDCKTTAFWHTFQDDALVVEI